MDRQVRASRSDESLVPLHQCDQLLDVGNRRVWKNAVPEIEDVWPVGERVKDSPRRFLKRLAASDECQRIEIALDGQRFRQLFRCPDWVHRLVEPDSADFRLARISGELAAR